MPIIPKCCFCGELGSVKSGNEMAKVARFCNSCNTDKKRRKVNEENIALGIEPKPLPSENIQQKSEVNEE